jgi:hypothetical protein
MNDLRKTVEMAKEMQNFVNDINDLKFTIEDVNDVAFFRPDIIDVISKIKDWFNTPTEEIIPMKVTPGLDYDGDFDGDKLDLLITDATPQPTEPVVVTETDTDTDKPKKKRRVTADDFYWIGYFICTECNGATVDIAINRAFEKYKDKISKSSVRRYVHKENHVDISDKFFTIKEPDVIVAATDPPLPSTVTAIPKLMDSISDINRNKFFEIIGDMPEDQWRQGLLSLIKFNGSVHDLYQDCINNNKEVTGEVLCASEVLKRASITSGLLNSLLDDFDMTIIISSVVAKIGNKRKISRINNQVKKIWGINIKSPQEIYNVISKKEYPEISDLFFR